MAKKEINKYVKEQRLLQIQNCKECKGNPITEECNLQGLVFNKCSKCEIIVGDYHKVGEQIKITESIKISGRHNDPDFGKTIEIEHIPGQPINFDQLGI